MNLPIGDLYSTFSDLAIRTNNIIYRGFSSDLGILEESITDVNLIEIATRHDEYIVTRKFTRKEEGSKSGADWLWCFGEPGSWISLLIQAKMINPKTLTCHYLDYNKGKQRALLIEFAYKQHLIPFYCIYSYLPNYFDPSKYHKLPLNSVDRIQWACSLVTPKYIKKLVKERKTKQIEILKYGIPWSRLFVNSISTKPLSLAHNMAASINAMRLQFDLTTSNKARSQRDDPDPNSLITTDLPPIVSRLLSQKIKPTDSPVSGVSLISTVPIEVLAKEYKILPTNNEDILFFDWTTRSIQNQKD